MADAGSFSSITPTPPTVTSIGNGIFEIVAAGGTTFNFTVPASYNLYVASVAPAVDLGVAGDWYQYNQPTSIIIYQKTDSVTWTVVTELLTGAGTGDVVGPVTSVADDIATFNGVTGKIINDSGSKVSDLIPKSIITAKGDLISATAASTPSSIAVGSNGDVLTADSTQAAGMKWAAPATSGTVTTVSVVTANGISGSVANATTTPAITITLGAINPSSIGATTPGSAAFTTASATGVITSTVATGTAPFTVSSTTRVSNLNVATAGLADTVTTNANLTGDVTSIGNATTLATVNSNVGSFGSATAAGVFTVNGKGLITAASSTTITPAVGSITGLGTGVATALAINTGSAGAFVLFNGSLGTPSSGTVTNLTGTASININGTVGATTPNTGAFTTLSTSGDYTISSGSSTGSIKHGGTAGRIIIDGDSGGAGAELILYGSTHATQASKAFLSTGVFTVQSTSGTNPMTYTPGTGLAVTGTLSTSGVITSTATGNILNSQTATTQSAYLRLQNTGGISYIGIENSTGSDFSATAYATVIRGPVEIDLMISGSKIAQASSTGLVVTGTLGMTGAFLPSFLTTKGDLIVATGSATTSRLGVGADGFVLTADSSQATGVKWSSAAGGTQVAYSVDTIAALKAIGATPTNKDIYAVGGFAADGDGGGGLFYWDSASTLTDNGGTIIKVTALATGRFFRIVAGTKGEAIQNNTLDVRWFGAIPDYATDCSAGVMAAFAALDPNANLHGGGCLYFPSGNYLVTGQIRLTATQGACTKVTIRGDGTKASKLMYNSTSHGMIYSEVETEMIDLWIESLVGQTAAPVPNGYVTVYLNGPTAKIRNVYSKECPNIIEFKATGNADVCNLHTDSSTSGCQWWQEGKELFMTHCSLSTGLAASADTYPAMVIRGSGSGSTTTTRITDVYMKGAGPWTSYDGGTAYATMVISGDYGTMNEGYVSDIMLDTGGGGNTSNSIALLMECMDSSYIIANWILSNLWLNSGVIGLKLSGIDAGLIKTLVGVSASNIIVRPTNSAGIDIIGVKDINISGLSVFPTGSTGTTGVKIANSGSNSTSGITIEGMVSPTNIPCSTGIEVVGTTVTHVTSFMTCEGVSNPYVLSGGASKTQGLVFNWPDGSGGMNCSGTLTQSV